MKLELTVRSTVITWPENTLEITDTTNGKHVVPLDKTITVTMVGYPDRETKTMPAHDLGDYMTSGYIIERISYEE